MQINVSKFFLVIKSDDQTDDNQHFFFQFHQKIRNHACFVFHNIPEFALITLPLGLVYLTYGLRPTINSPC